MVSFAFFDQAELVNSRICYNFIDKTQPKAVAGISNWSNKKL